MRPAWDEVERLAALRAYGVLDATSTAEFDDFVQIAAQVCEAPVAVVNLIDETRQWFAAEIGLGVRETPLDISICAHAILQPDVLVVPDLTQDSRFDCNPLVTGEPKLRFYGGALLETSQGLPLGTMCVLDYKARPQGLTKDQVFTLTALARQVMARLELRRAVEEKELLIQEAHHRVKNSLQLLQGLLLLQAKATTHPGVAHELRQSVSRINTFGTMHEQLYRVGAGVTVDLAAYMRDLVTAQKEALASTLDGRDIVLDASAGRWSTSDAPSVGLIVLELTTNALKHGAGKVSVTVRQADDELTLSVEDEGVELPAAYEPSHSKGLGMRVLTGLLKARRGRLTIDRTRGHTCFIATMHSSLPRTDRLREALPG